MKLNSFSYTCIPYTNTHKHRISFISSLHLHFWVHQSAGSPFLPPDKNRKLLQFFHHQYSNNNIFSFQFGRDFSALHKQILISMGSYFPEACAFGNLITSTKYIGLKSAKLFDHAPINDPNLESLVFIKLNQCRLYSNYYPGSH